MCEGLRAGKTQGAGSPKKKKSVADRDAEERTELTRCVTRMNSRGFFVFIAVVRKKTIKHKELSKQFPISLQHAQMQSHT